MILKYPDGTMSYAYKSGRQDKWLEFRQNNEAAAWQNGLLSNFQIMQIDDEVDFLVNNMEFIIDPDTAMREYF